MMGQYERLRVLAEEAAGEWVEYQQEFKTWHSAQSVANQLRHRFTGLEIKCVKGVIRARVRMGA